MTRFLLVCLGGAIGSGARYLTATWAVGAFGPAFPAGTLIVNLAGSFLIAFVMQLASGLPSFPPDLRLFLTTGVMGGFTTYSAFNYETTQYMRNGIWGVALLNLVVTVAGCLCAGVAGLAVARLIAR